jgi:hypothetical protein
MKFDNLYKSLLEDFNIPPQYQNAVQSGPDAGITSGDVNNTFPSKISNLNVSLPKPKKKKIKQPPKGMSAKYRQGIHVRNNRA